MTDDRRALLESVGAYYTARLTEFGPTARGVDWNGQPSHELRHRQFLRLLDGSPEASVDASILDLGCGFGDFFRFVRARGYRGHYTGCDVSAAMIAEAIRLHGEGTDRIWRVGAEPRAIMDFAVASGIFNVKGDVPAVEWAAYVRDTIDTLAGYSRRGFAFNVLSLSSDPDRRRGNLYYADPSETLAWCLRRFGRGVALLQDYGLLEFTMIVRSPFASADS